MIKIEKEEKRREGREISKKHQANCE